MASFDDQQQDRHWMLMTSFLADKKRTPPTSESGAIPALTAISHEVRTPLNAIIGFSEIMKDEQFGPMGNEKYLDYSGDIFHSAHHALNLINDLLDLSKLKAGKWRVHPENLDINDQVRKEIRMVRALAQQKNIVLRTDLEENLPLIYVDQRAINQILLNLLANGIKYNREEGHLRLKTEQVKSKNGAPSFVRLILTDNGIGMTEAELEQAMRPFEQITAPKERQTRAGSPAHKRSPDIENNPEKGSGLGLPISKALADANNISFAIDSKKGEGTTITLEFRNLAPSTLS